MPVIFFVCYNSTPSSVAHRTLLFVLYVTGRGEKSQISFGQSVKLLSGHLIEVKGQTSFDIMFSYDSMVVGDTTREDDYLQKKKIDWDLKQPGRGDVFVGQWYEDREDLYEPSFEASFEKYLLRNTRDRNSKYTFILKTKRTEGGWNIGVTSHPGEIDGEIWIVETNNESNVIAKIGFYNIKGKLSCGGDFEMTTRISSAYVEAGRYLGFYLRNKLK